MNATTFVVPDELNHATWIEFTSSEHDYKLEKTEITGSLAGTYLRKKQNPSQIYKLEPKNGGGDHWLCLTCKTEILGAQVAHPIHDGPFPLSGSGSCWYEEVPYCPECEQKPPFHGRATTSKF